MQQVNKKSCGAIAFCGTRGLPANYGGFETAVDEITMRLVDGGHECHVFCRQSSQEKQLPTHRNRKLIYVKGSARRQLDTFVSSIQTGWYLWKHRHLYRHVFWFNNANLPGILMTHMAGIPLSVNTDGLEWRRAKWSWPFKVYFYVCSFFIARICRNLISDSSAIQNYYAKKFAATSFMIPYGTPKSASISKMTAQSILDRFDLQSGRFLLQVTRIEPDNLPLVFAHGFIASKLGERGYQAVIIGFKDMTPYALYLKSLDRHNGVRILPSLYEPAALQVLREHCFCYVHGNSVGGTNPALLEAMAACPRILAIDSEFSHEVLGKCGHYFDERTINQSLRYIVHTPENTHELRERVNSRYNWDAVTECYADLADLQKTNYEIALKGQMTHDKKLEAILV